MQEVEFILYVADQERSQRFYESVLGAPPVLSVPGMTEFELSPGCKLGLMPESGIAKILGAATANPSSGNGVPRCELYLVKADAAELYQRALLAGAKEVSPMQARNWGHTVGYVADPDGHILAFAITQSSASS